MGEGGFLEVHVVAGQVRVVEADAYAVESQLAVCDRDQVLRVRQHLDDAREVVIERRRVGDCGLQLLLDVGEFLLGGAAVGVVAALAGDGAEAAVGAVERAQLAEGQAVAGFQFLAPLAQLGQALQRALLVVRNQAELPDSTRSKLLEKIGPTLAKIAAGFARATATASSCSGRAASSAPRAPT